MRRAISTYGRYVAAIVFLAVVSVIAGVYILIHQRLQLPFQDRYSLSAEFSTSESLTPGLGLPVNVAGVRVGQINGAELRDGRSVVHMQIDPGKLPRVYADAQALLRPNTPLKDMQVELYPGHPPARVISPGGTIPIAQTNPPIDSDNFLGALDSDTRSMFDALISAADRGTAGRGPDLRALLRALGPTTEQVRQIGDSLAKRRHAIARLVHNLSVVSRAAGARDQQLGHVVAAGDATIAAIAGQDAALRSSIAALPGTLAAAHSGLVHGTTFARALGPTLDQLQPTVHRLTPALHAAGPLLDVAVPVLRDRVRPLIRSLKPVAADLLPASRDLAKQTPDLTSAVNVIKYISNELLYNPPGKDEGLLYWLAWFGHDADSVFSTEDAHGAVWRGLALLSCNTLSKNPGLAPALSLLTGPLPVCPPNP